MLVISRVKSLDKSYQTFWLSLVNILPESQEGAVFQVFLTIHFLVFLFKIVYSQIINTRGIYLLYPGNVVSPR